MKANQFVKAYGLKRIRHLLTMSSNAIVYCLDGEHVHVDDLKRLVESHELIEQYNGLFEAKELIRVSPKMTSELRELAAAIADVESCL